MLTQDQDYLTNKTTGGIFPVDGNGNAAGYRVGRSKKDPEELDEIKETKLKSLSADLKANDGNHLKAAHAFYKREFQGKYVVTKIDGKDAKVTFIGGSWQHMKRNMNADHTKAELVPHLADIIKTGKSTPFVSSKHYPYDGFVYFYKHVDVGNRKILAVIDVGRRSDGIYEYCPYSLNHSGFFNFSKKVEEIRKATGKKITEDSFSDRPQENSLGVIKPLPLGHIITNDLPIIHIGFEENFMENNTLSLRREALSFDAESRRRYDDNGFLHVDGCHITKEQVVPYYGHEIPDFQKFGLDPNRMYKGYRPAEELEKVVATFNGLPLLLYHHPESAFNSQKEYRVDTVHRWAPVFPQSANNHSTS